MSTIFNDLAPFLREFGIPILLLIAGAWFFAAQVFPYLKQLIDDARRDTREERREFLSVLARYNATMTEQGEMLREIAESLRTHEARRAEDSKHLTALLDKLNQ